MNREFSVIIEKDEDGYFVASVPSLKGCHTQAKSLDILMKRIEKEAIELCLEVEAPAATESLGSNVWRSLHEQPSRSHRSAPHQGST